MASYLVERATSDMLIGPDWAMNIEICDIVNRDPGQAKEVVKAVKKRIGNKNPKIQLLALTLLETLIKNCGDYIHHQVVDRDVLYELVKIAKKKADLRVKEKILLLIDTWQEAFGGASGKYPQYYAAYHDLLRAGIRFPQRAAISPPIHTPPQTHPIQTYSESYGSTDYRADSVQTSRDSDLPNLSLSEIHNARGIVDVLLEMLNALDSQSKEELKQEVIVDLVEQCRSYKQRVVQLVNTTSDENLLSQALALNDDLQCALGKHDAIASGVYVPQEKKRSSQYTVDTGDKATKLGASSSSTVSAVVKGESATLPPPPGHKNNSAAPTVDKSIDLLSGDLISFDDDERTSQTATTQQSMEIVVSGFSDQSEVEQSKQMAYSFPSESPAGNSMQIVPCPFPDKIESEHSMQIVPVSIPTETTEQSMQIVPLSIPQQGTASNSYNSYPAQEGMLAGQSFSAAQKTRNPFVHSNGNLSDQAVSGQHGHFPSESMTAVEQVNPLMYGSGASNMGSGLHNIPQALPSNPHALPQAPQVAPYGYYVVPVYQPFQQHLFQQHPFLLQQASTFGQYSPSYYMAAQQDLIRGTQNLSLYELTNNKTYQRISSQQPAISGKQVKKEDRLFADLVDIAKSKSVATTSKTEDL